VRKVFIAKRCNKEGRSYGFVWFKGVSDARELEVKLDNIFINDYKLFVNLPRFARTTRTQQLKQKGSLGGKLNEDLYKPRVETTTPPRRTYAEATAKGAAPGVNMRGEAATHTISITPIKDRGYWCKDAWVGRLKKVMAVESIEDRVAWDLGYNICTKFLGDDMILLMGLSEEKAHHIIQTEKNNGSSLFYSLERWRPGCRPHNRVVWLQVWGFPIKVWGADHFRKAASCIGDIIELDDDTEDRRRLDRARLLVRTPLPPSILKEITVRAGELDYQVWFVEETWSGEAVNQKTNSLSDVWSDEVTSEDGGIAGEDDDDIDGASSYSLELPPPNPESPRNHQVEGESNGHCDEHKLMGKTHFDEDHRDETVIRKEGTQGPFTANVDPGIREAETKVGIALSKESIEHRSQADSRKKGNHSKGKNFEWWSKGVWRSAPLRGIRARYNANETPHTLAPPADPIRYWAK